MVNALLLSGGESASRHGWKTMKAGKSLYKITPWLTVASLKYIESTLGKGDDRPVVLTYFIIPKFHLRPELECSFVLWLIIWEILQALLAQQFLCKTQRSHNLETQPWFSRCFVLFE